MRIDGSYGEGGGQILRSSASLSALTGKPVEISNIRAKRSRPGLQPQHLKAVLAAAEVCKAKVQGAEPGSRHLLFEPSRKPQAGEYRFDIGTAGATTLVIQAILTPLLQTREESRIVVTGGTHNDHAPCAEYLEFVLLPALERAGVRYSFSYPTAGYYPRGGGEIRLTLHAPDGLQGVDLRRSERKPARAIAVTSGLQIQIAERGLNVLKQLDSNPLHRDVPSPGIGAAAISYVAGLAGFTGLGARGKPMETVAGEAVDPMKRFLGQNEDMDEHLADQLVVPLSCADGKSRYTTWQSSEHLRTVMWVVRYFLPTVLTLDEREDGSAEVTIEP